MAFGNFKNWCERLENSDWGKVQQANLKYDVSNQRIPQPKLSQFRDQVTNCDDEIDLTLVIDTIVTRTTTDPFYLQGPEIKNDDGDFARVISLRRYLRDNVRGLRIADTLPRDVVRELSDATGKLREAILDSIRSRHKGRLRGRLPFAWITRYSELTTRVNLDSSDNAADRIRDALGLSYPPDPNGEAESALVAICYPNEVCDALTVRSPTSFDGGGGPPYCSCNGTDGWGRTVYLQDGKGGLPEAVHSEIGFSPDFEVTLIGSLTKQPGPPPIDDILDRLRYNRRNACVTDCVHDCRLDTSMTDVR